MAAVQRQVLAALSTGHERNLETLNVRANDIRTELQNEVNSFTRTFAIQTNAALQPVTPVNPLMNEEVAAGINYDSHVIIAKIEEIMQLQKKAPLTDETIEQLINLIKNKEVGYGPYSTIVKNLYDIGVNQSLDTTLQERLNAARASMTRVLLTREGNSYQKVILHKGVAL